MTTKFFTNSGENTLINKFEGVFINQPNIHCFDVLVGYFRASGYFRIRPFLNRIPKIRILVGINVDQLIADAQQQGLAFFVNHEKTKDEFMQRILEDIQNAKYTKEIEQGILQFIDDVIEKKIEVKAHPDKKIHSKVYILRPDPFNEHTPASVITGSSNLTDAGLGGGNVFNYEFNVLLSEYADVKFATDEFEQLWTEAIDALPVQNIKPQTYLNETTPFELYIKLLIEYFGNTIDYDPNSIGDLPPKFKKLSYQIDAVNEGYQMLLRHNGFVLADVVGLGKTVIATMVAKKFTLENGKENTKILVVYPPAVEKNWKDTFKFFLMDQHTKFISNGSLSKIIDGHQDYWSKEEYDLVIVDESHKFRNHTTGVFQNLQLICKSPRSTKGLVEGTQKKVILVTATPLNNKPDDIFYQIQMFQDARQSTLPITNLTSFFSPLMEQYKTLKRFDELDVTKLRDIYGQIRKNIIEPITIRRTRTDLEKIDAYKADLEAQGIVFPKVKPPQKVEYIMDEELNLLFYKTVEYLTKVDENDIPVYISYARYKAIAALKKDIQEQYYENAETVSKSLAYIMKTQLVKRLESSFYAFKKSLSNFLKTTDRMIAMFEHDKIFIAPDADINKLLDKGWSDDDIEKEIERLSEENPKNRTFHKADFKPGFWEALQKDSLLLQELVTAWNAIEHDPKLDVFIAKLTTEFLNKDHSVEGKLVIFSESKDTVDYLAKTLGDLGRTDVLIISAFNRKQMYDTIVRNFDANCDTGKQLNDYHIIVTTEVLAEGVNLHRSNTIVHYDTPWNSTRLMQRIGRVNRIGSKASFIYNYVFYPSAQGDSQISLNKTAFMKIQAFHSAFGEDNQVYSEEEILDEMKLFNNEAIREEEDERLKYLYQLRNFQKDNKDWFDKIKAIPLKSRTGRNATTINKLELQNGTVTFLKTDKKFEFYWVSNECRPKEITPIEAFKIFEASQKEKVAPLIDRHHEHVGEAITHFETIEQKLLLSQTDPEALGGVAQRAKSWLSGLMKYPQVADKQKETIKKIVILIDLGRYTNLPSDIDRLQKRKPKLNTTLDELDQIAQRYDIEQSDAQKSKKHKAEVPVLIISESFE